MGDDLSHIDRLHSNALWILLKLNRFTIKQFHCQMLQEEFMVLGLKFSKFNQEQQHPCIFGNPKIKPKNVWVFF